VHDSKIFKILLRGSTSWSLSKSSGSLLSPGIEKVSIFEFIQLKNTLSEGETPTLYHSNTYRSSSFFLIHLIEDIEIYVLPIDLKGPFS